MVNITFRPDDSGIQSLQQENTRGQTAREVNPLTATNRTQTATEQDTAPNPQATPAPVYRGVERRKGERRKQQQRIILDTRDKRDRRRQAQDENQDAPAPRRGIDVYG